MATSQFTIYQSGDYGAPSLTGITGSFLTLLNSCLYTGYGSKPSAGWLKPLPDTASYGMLTQPTGSGFSIFIKDTGPGAAAGREARISGWEAITTIDNGNVTGSNPFPTAVQQPFGSAGAVIVRKSTSADTVQRSWVLIADSSSFYFFDQAESATQTYYWGYAFGDIYSYNTGSDLYKCMIVGKTAENDISTLYEAFDDVSLIQNTCQGSYLARTYNGSGTSIKFGKHGDSCKNSNYLSGWVIFIGFQMYPNGPDNGLYMTPIYITEGNGTTGFVRGIMRGLYLISHREYCFADGQLFNGSGDFAGKTFRILRTTGQGCGVLAIETSNTVDTN